MLALLLLNLLLNLLQIGRTQSTIKELNSVKWSEMGLRNVCPFDEFHYQFSRIKHEFKKCLHFKHILFDVDFNSADPMLSLSQSDLDDIEEEREMQKHFAAISYSKNKLLNPFCKLAKQWTGCIGIISPLNCVESNAKSLIPVYLPRTVQEQLRRLYELHAKQMRVMQSPDALERYVHSGNHVDAGREEQQVQQLHNQIRQLKFEQLAGYFRFRCDQRVNLHIDSIEMDVLAKQQSLPPAIDRFQQEAFSDIF